MKAKSKPHRKRWGRIFLVFLAIILLAAIFTNPGEQVHKDTLKAKSKAIMNEIVLERNDAVGAGVWQLGGNRLLNEFIESNVSVDNYWLFSILKIHWDGKSYIIGVGAFSKVYITRQLSKDVIQPILEDMERSVSDSLSDFLRQWN
jgi:hypothetical protein